MASRGAAVGIAVGIAALAVVSAQTPAPGFPLPAALPEDVKATDDFPYLPPPPGTRLVRTLTIHAPLELKQASANDEAVIAGGSYIRKTYEWVLPRTSAPFLATYRDSLFASGWKLVEVSRIPEAPNEPGTVHVSAHYRDDGRNIYARVTQEPDGPLQVEVADVGAEDWAAALARDCRLPLHSIHFELDGPNLKLAESEPSLRKLAALLTSSLPAPNSPLTTVEIQGHVDNVGEAASEARQVLSERRAQAVMAWLTTHGGVPANRITAKGYGRTRPVADNDNDLGRALNRRIEVAREDCAAGLAPDARLKLGYTGESSLRQVALERRFQSGVESASLSALHRPLTGRPHPAGTDATAALVQHLRQTLTGFGLDVSIHEYQALLSFPRSVELTQTSPARRAIRVTEPVMAGDPTSSHGELGGGYIAYSASGTATGQIVFVNYGLPADYAELQARGVAVKDRIALARYGRSHRAVKVHTAQQAGARAVILYSDPADDGPAKGPAWPAGYWRGGDMLQRGNAKFSWFWHGDPLTPGVAATATADRLDPATAPTLPRIPVVVVAANEAAVLRSTPAATVQVAVDMDQRLRPIYNVVASLKGRAVPERVILLGTHHDAWTFGGVDPGTGMTALLEVAKGLGALAKSGWRPWRTISLAFWDAEEFGLVGSTEYAEDRRAALQEQLIAYVNTDMYMKGRFDPGGVPSLRDFVADVTRDVRGAGPTSVYEEWQQSSPSTTPDLEPLGSGADFVPFQDHLGVPALAIEFIGENGYGFGTYHSNYDSRAYVERVADPGFAQGAVLARVLGTLALRMSEADVLPFRYSHYAAKLTEAIGSAGTWAAAAKMSIDVPALSSRAAGVAAAARALETAIDARLRSGGLAAPAAAALNDRLARLEQRLADDDGAPESRWYRHVFYGWNIYSLYDGQPFPGLAEALRVRDAARVANETARITRALDRMHAELTAALADVR